MRYLLTKKVKIILIVAALLTAGLVVLSNRSFITEYGKYKSSNDTFTPYEGVTVPDGYVSEIYKQVSAMFKHSGNIVTNDYYGSLENRLNNAAPWQE